MTIARSLQHSINICYIESILFNLSLTKTLKLHNRYTLYIYVYVLSLISNEIVTNTQHNFFDPDIIELVPIGGVL